MTAVIDRAGRWHPRALPSPTTKSHRKYFIMKSSFIAIAAALGTATVQPVHAEEAAEATGSDIVVTATRSVRSIDNVPVSVSVVNANRIATTPAKSLDDILRRVPSVDLPIASSGEIHPTADNISMRGLGGIRALVLLDGVPLNDPFFGTVQWGRAPLEAIDRVEIVRGGGATLWGNYAMGGVINILRRDPDRTALALQASGGMYSTWRTSANAAYVVSDAVKFTLDAEANHTDGYNETLPAERGPITVPTSFNAHNLAFGGVFQLGEGLTAHARIAYHHNDQPHYSTRLQSNRQHNWVYSGDISREFGSGATLTATAFHTDGLFQTDNAGTPDGFASNAAEYIQNRHFSRVHDTGVSLVWSQPIEGVLRSYSIGADYHGISGEDDADIFSETGTRLRTDIGRGKQRFLGGFMQASIHPVEAFEILASVRYQTFLNYQAYDGNPGGLLGNIPSQRTTSVDPRVSLRYAVAPHFALRAAGYSAFRAPTMDNLYRTVSVPQGIFYSDASLKPETLNGGEVGFDYVRPGFRGQVTLYTNTIKNLLTYRNLADSELPPGFAFGSRNINAGAARSRGIEAEASWTLNPNWSLSAGYTYADSIITENVLDPASVGLQQMGIPKHKLTGSVTWTSPHGLTITPQLRWFSKSYGDNDHTLPVDSHVVVDLSASYPLADRFNAFAQVQNLFDNRYVADNNGFEPRRLSTPLTATFGVRVKLD